MEDTHHTRDKKLMQFHLGKNSELADVMLWWSDGQKWGTAYEIVNNNDYYNKI